MVESDLKHDKDFKTSVKSKKLSSREDLRNLFKRYYELLGYIIKERDGLLEIFEPQSKKPIFKFVFDRKSSLSFPNAELITFNSNKLLDLINTTFKKGNIAKAYIPFSFVPKSTFSTSLDKLISTDNNLNNKFVINGEIVSLGHYISYIPFLIFIVKIELKSLESVIKIEKPVIPLIKSNIKLKINEDFYVQKIKSYFNSENPNLSSEMSIEGEILNINEKDFRGILKKAVQEIEVSVNGQKDLMREKTNERLRKEIDILENYYDQQTEEIENQIKSAKERGKIENLENFKQNILNIEKEKEFKCTEYESIYRLQTNYELIGGALIYVPAIFYFKCEISSHFGSIEKNLEYNIFNNEIIAPNCVCGKPINQGVMCQNLHFSCLECSFSCEECNKQICRNCDMYFCKTCNVPLCSEHYNECNSCGKKGIKNKWICNDHLNCCENCETILCPECSVACIICEQILCKSNKECSFKCEICKKDACFEHSFSCTFDNKMYCINEACECSLCHQTYCTTHFFLLGKGVCKTCAKSSIEKFYKFLRAKKAQLKLPSIINMPNNHLIVKRKIKRRTYYIPYNQVNIKMGENKNYFVFIIKNLKASFTLVYNKENNNTKLFYKPSFIGKLINVFKKDKIPNEIELDTQVLSFKTKKSKKRKIIEKKILMCLKCNKHFSEDYKICPYCGQKLEI